MKHIKSNRKKFKTFYFKVAFLKIEKISESIEDDDWREKESKTSHKNKNLETKTEIDNSKTLGNDKNWVFK